MTCRSPTPGWSSCYLHSLEARIRQLDQSRAAICRIRSRDSGDWASSSATRRAMFGAETSSTCTRLACSRGPCLATETSDDSQAEAESTARRPKATCELTDQEREAPCGTSPRTGSFSTWMYLPPAVRDAITLITDIAAASIKTTTKTATSAPRSVRGWSRSGCTRGRPQTGYPLGESRPPGLRWSLRCPEWSILSGQS